MIVEVVFVEVVVPEMWEGVWGQSHLPFAMVGSCAGTQVVDGQQMESDWMKLHLGQIL